MQYVKKGQLPIWIKLFKCCTVGVAVYSALTSPLIHLFASPIKAVRVRVNHLQPLQNLLNLFIPLLYRFSHRFFLFENQANHEIRFSTFFEVRSIQLVIIIPAECSFILPPVSFNNCRKTHLFILFAFWCVTLADIVKEHSLHRDGPISSVKLFSLTSCKTEAIDGKNIFLYIVTVIFQVTSKFLSCNYRLWMYSRDNPARSVASNTMELAILPPLPGWDPL